MTMCDCYSYTARHKKTPSNIEISTFRTVFNILARHAGFEPATFAQNIEFPTFTCIVATQGATHIYINHDNKSGRPFQVLRSSAFVLFLKMFTLTSQILS
nr:MAG TPA: hypothetical protein [Caudoviricetes sp.]